ncbi:HIT family protein [Rhodococcoides fascians]|uniref:HIT family protein n=1 Tax=Rhodococcoides fascians TaxID=1828 RepID=UPI00056ADF39|nr:HIT domain-containing protein [Rhodococcus fascians]
MKVETVTHEPARYNCPFCRYIRGEFDELNAKTDLVVRTEFALARISPKWWPHNPGHLLVLPVEHFENLYTLPRAVGHALFDLVQTAAIVMRETYECDGVSTRQHNEPAGNQDLWHHHIHIFPRYTDDHLYTRHDDAVHVPSERRAPYAERLRAKFSLS